MKKNRRWIIPLDQIPQKTRVHEFILSQTDLSEQIKKFSKKQFPTYIELPLNLKISTLKKSVLGGLNQYGSDVFKPASLESYHSAELTRPDPKMKMGRAFDNTYINTAFNPLARHGEIATLLQSFERTVFKSRIAILKSERSETQRLNFMWHQDESIFLNLRVNIPVVTSSNYAIQVLRENRDQEASIEEFTMRPGFSYIYNTGALHRAYCKKLSTVERIHIIIGCSPWFDFDPNAKAWVSNEFYGKVHPFEMFRGGQILNLSKAAL